MRLQVLMVVLL